jgi:hypothetical protein
MCGRSSVPPVGIANSPYQVLKSRKSILILQLHDRLASGRGPCVAGIVFLQVMAVQEASRRHTGGRRRFMPLRLGLFLHTQELVLASTQRDQAVRGSFLSGGPAGCVGVAPRDASQGLGGGRSAGLAVLIPLGNSMCQLSIVQVPFQEIFSNWIRPRSGVTPGRCHHCISNWNASRLHSALRPDVL